MRVHIQYLAVPGTRKMQMYRTIRSVWGFARSIFTNASADLLIFDQNKRRRLPILRCVFAQSPNLQMEFVNLQIEYVNLQIAFNNLRIDKL